MEKQQSSPRFGAFHQQKSKAQDAQGPMYREILRDSKVLEDFHKTDMDSSSMNELAERLDAIRTAAKDGSMSSYGSGKTFALKRIEQLRKSQIHIFKRHMELELSFPNLEENEDFSSKEFSERFQKKFYEKEQEMNSITGTLEGLTRLLGQVNEDSKSGNLARDPSIDEVDGSDMPGHPGGLGSIRPSGRMMISFNGDSSQKVLRMNHKQSFRHGYTSTVTNEIQEGRDSWMNQLDLRRDNVTVDNNAPGSEQDKVIHSTSEVKKGANEDP